MFAGRTSTHEWWSNLFRLLLSSLAHILLESIRHTALKGTELETAQASIFRLKFEKSLLNNQFHAQVLWVLNLLIFGVVLGCDEIFRPGHGVVT